MQGHVTEATEGLLAIEKTQRLAEDVGGTRRACQALLEVLHAAGDWKGLNDHILLLTKRRSQLKQARILHPAHLPTTHAGSSRFRVHSRFNWISCCDVAICIGAATIYKSGPAVPNLHQSLVIGHLDYIQPWSNCLLKIVTHTVVACTP